MYYVDEKDITIVNGSNWGETTKFTIINTEYELISLGEFGFFIKTPYLVSGRYYVHYSDSPKTAEFHAV